MNKINTKELHQIFVNLKENREKSFNELYEKYDKLIYAISFSILKNKENSEDIVQIVFTKIYRLDNKKLPETNEASWLYTLTKNESLNYLKKQNNIVALDELMDIPYEDTELNKIIDEDSYKRLMNKLDEKEREIVNLKVIAGMKFKDISNLLNMPMRNSSMEILYCIT
jgi:RNA polymerase sigma factor (sigma-70 family)